MGSFNISAVSGKRSASNHLRQTASPIISASAPLPSGLPPSPTWRVPTPGYRPRKQGRYQALLLVGLPTSNPLRRWGLKPSQFLLRRNTLRRIFRSSFYPFFFSCPGFPAPGVPDTGEIAMVHYPLYRLWILHPVSAVGLLSRGTIRPPVVAVKCGIAGAAISTAYNLFGRKRHFYVNFLHHFSTLPFFLWSRSFRRRVCR